MQGGISKKFFSAALFKTNLYYFAIAFRVGKGQIAQPVVYI